MKNYKIETEDRGDYLYAYYEAQRDSIQLSNEIWKRIANAVEEAGHTKLLVVENIKENPSTVLEMYQIIQASFNLGFVGKSIAFVDLIEEHFKHNKFGETLAVNLGINARQFKTVQEAKNWFKKQP